MKTRAAVLWESGTDWVVEDIDLAAPRHGEVLVELAACGVCHSDDHLATGDMLVPQETLDLFGMGTQLPLIGGHEGAGTVVEVGPGVTSVAVGDHVATSFVPTCGRCHFCLTGRHHLCDLGATLLQKGQIADGKVLHTCRGTELGQMCKVGAFAEHTVVSEASVIKVDADIPFAVAALVSCGVATGFGSAVNRAGTRPGDTVAVMGVGGVGMSAVQGARIAGATNIVAIDPIEWKREKAREFGATHTAASAEEALGTILELSWGRMAERVIVTVGVLDGELLQSALALTGKGGTCVVTSVAPVTQTHAAVDLFQLAMWNKELKGTIFGSWNPRVAIPHLLALHRSGQLDVEGLVTRTYSLDEVNDATRAVRAGDNIRGLITF